MQVRCSQEWEIAKGGHAVLRSGETAFSFALASQGARNMSMSLFRQLYPNLEESVT